MELLVVQWNENKVFNVIPVLRTVILCLQFSSMKENRKKKNRWSNPTVEIWARLTTMSDCSNKTAFPSVAENALVIFWRGYLTWPPSTWVLHWNTVSKKQLTLVSFHCDITMAYLKLAASQHCSVHTSALLMPSCFQYNCFSYIVAEFTGHLHWQVEGCTLRLKKCCKKCKVLLSFKCFVASSYCR